VAAVEGAIRMRRISGRTRGHRREHHRQEPEVVGVGQELRLRHRLAVEHRDGLALGGEGVAAAGHEVARPLSQAIARRRIPHGDVARERGLVDLAPLGEQGRDHRDADAAADVARHAVDRGRVHELVAPDRGQGQRRQRHEHEPERKALDESR
jgi:hypothetical protein